MARMSPHRVHQEAPSGVVGQHHAGSGGGSPGTGVLSFRLLAVCAQSFLSIPAETLLPVTTAIDRQDLALQERGPQTVLWPSLGSNLRKWRRMGWSCGKAAATLEVLVSCAGYYISYDSYARKKPSVDWLIHKRMFYWLT